MLGEGNWFSQFCKFVGDLIATRNVTFMLAVGIALLTIALMILTRTRWGQAKPVSKCIALSILAHVLLGGYAWGTKLMFAVPDVQTQHPTSVRLISDVSEASPEVASQTEPVELKPWQKFDSSEAPESKSTAEILRPQFSKQYEVTKKEVFHQPLKVVQPEIQKQPLKIVESNTVPSRPASHQIESSSTDAKTIPVNRRPRVQQPAKNILTPTTEQPARLEASNVKIESRDKSEGETGQPIDVQKRINDVTANPLVTNRNSNNHLKAVDQRLKQVRNQHEGMIPFDQVAKTSPKRFDGKIMPKIYRLRSAENRLDAVKELGGSEQTETAVKLALAWLAKQQQADGRWNPRHTGGGQEKLVLGHNRQGAGTNADTGITGLAILSFLGAGHTQHKGQYQETVRKGLEFLIKKQKQNGSLAGDARLFAQMYCHSMALFALSEAYAITGDKNLRPAVENGVRYSLTAQNPNDGGWRYQPGDAGDMSQFGWQVMALKAAKLGGIDVPDSTFLRMKKFLDRCSFGNNKGLAAYRPVEKVSTTMTAEALTCRFFLYGKVDRDTGQEAANYMRRAMPDREHINYYYWYYGTLAMFHTGGESWTNWNRELSTLLVKSQNRQGDARGSWDANGLWSGYGGQVYSTAMATLCLEVYYRYLSSLK